MQSDDLTKTQEGRKVIQWLKDGSSTSYRIHSPNGCARLWTEDFLDDIANTVDDSSILPHVAVWVYGSDGCIRKMLMQILDQLELLEKTVDNNEKEEGEEEEVDTIESLQQKICISLEKKLVLFVFDDINNDYFHELMHLGVLQFREMISSSKMLFLGDQKNDELVVANSILYLEVEVYSIDDDSVAFTDCSKESLQSLDDVFNSSDLSALVKAVVQECKGIEMEIYILASTFRSLRDLAEPKPITEHLQKLISLRKKFSMDVKTICCEMLSKTVTKDCFLYCYAKYEVYHRINKQELVQSWIREGFFRGLHSFEKSVDEGNHILEELLDRFLLENLDEDHVKVHSGMSAFQQRARGKHLVRARSRWDYKEQLEEIESKEAGWSLEHSLKRFVKFAPEGDPISVQSSSSKAVGKVWEWLNYADVGTIEIEGELGMGSTWTASRVKANAIKSKIFEVVIWVDVARQHCNRSNMLKQIATQLELPLMTEGNAENEKEIPGLLKQQISKFLEEKKYLLILHDMRLYFSTDLDELGIPRPHQQNKSSKVLITGREYCADNESVDRIISLTSQIPFEEACYLFCEESGLYFSSHYLQFRFRAENLVKCCKGGPQEIIIQAGALKNLKGGYVNPTFIANHLETALELRKTFTYQKVCYEMLPSQTLKDCFLYCTQYREYDTIHETVLITSWIVEGFLDNFNCLTEAYNKGRCILQELVDRYLLSKSDDEDYVKVMMHDSLRDRQLYELDRGGETFSVNPALFVEGPQINLMDVDLKPKYSQILKPTSYSTLLLYGDGDHQPHELPDSFFEEMLGLEVVIIIGAGLKSLPSSLSCVNKLSVLVLRGCALENLDNIASLNLLEVLNISSNSSLKEIPDNYFNHMLKLRTLNLSSTMIECLPTSLSNIWRLEYLILRGCPNLKSMPQITDLCSLIVIDLCNSKSFTGFPQEGFGCKTDLQILDLSGTQVKELSFLPRCINLQKLVLKDCLNLKKLPDLERLQFLSVLRE